MVFNLISFIYYKIENIRYGFSRKKIHKYRKVKEINSLLHGYNTLFEGVSITECEIGEFSYIQKYSTLYKTKVGKFCSIADHVRTGFGNHPTEMVSTYPSFYSDTKTGLGYSFFNGDSKYEMYRKTKNGFLVEIGNDVWIGAQTLILDGVTIGDGAVIAAGSIVTKDIEPYAIYGGVPAKLIRYRFSSSIIEQLLKIEWWNCDLDWIINNYDLFKDVDILLKNCHDRKNVL